MATTEYGKWSPMMDAPPASGHGVGIDWRGDPTGYAVVVQVAPINSTNLSGATQPVWLDITGRVIDLSWNAGDPDLESRLPVNSAAVRILGDITDIVGTDPIAVWTGRNDRFGTQCLIRWGIRTPGGLYRPLFAGIIDTITEDWTPDQPERVLELTCFDVSYLIAGYRGAAIPGYSLTSVELGVMAILTAIGFPFTRQMYGGPPFSWWDTTVETDPTTNPLNMLHRILDSGSAVMLASGAGRLDMQPWDYSLQPNATTYTVVDGYYFVSSDPAYAFPTFSTTITATFMRWVHSVDRMARDVIMSTSKIPGGTYSNSVAPLSLRYRGREDRAGWPKMDLLNNDPLQIPDLNAAALRFSDPLRLDVFTVDTQTADVAAPLSIATVIDFLSTACEPARWYRVQRRQRGVDGWISLDMVTRYAEHYLTRDRNQWRWIATVHPSWSPFA